MLKHKSWALIEFSLLLWSLSPMAVLLARDEVSFLARRDLWLGGALNSVAVGDFNGDARADLAVANEMINSVFILLGNGDGTFDTARAFAVESGSYSVAIGDFNSDDIQDLAVAGSSVFVLLGNGDGTFRSAQAFAAGKMQIRFQIWRSRMAAHARFPSCWGMAMGRFEQHRTCLSEPVLRQLL